MTKLTDIQPAPIPTNISWGKMGDTVVIQFNTQQGMSVFFFDLETARKIGAAFTEFATGIIAPSLTQQIADAAMKKRTT